MIWPLSNDIIVDKTLYTMKRTILLVLFATLTLGLAAQTTNTFTLRGALVDSKSSEPLRYANCVLLKAQDSTFAYGATTDEKGAFHFKQVAAGDYLLRINYMGYQARYQAVSISANTDLGNIALSHSATVLEAVKITAQKPLYAVDGEKSMYNTTEDPSIQTGTASDALQNAPGVEVDAEGNITLRGVSSVEIWINDRPSHMNEEALKQYIKQLPANAIERIEVITNPSARYSTSGGVINIVTNQNVKRNELLCLGLRSRTSPSLSPWVSYVWANEKVDFNLYVGADWSKHRSYGSGETTLIDPATDSISRFQSHHDTTRSDNIGGYTGLNLNWKISDKTNLATWMGFYPFWGNSHSIIDLDYKEYNPLRDLGYRYTHDNDDGMFWGGYAGAWLEHRFDTTGRKISFSLNGNTYNNSGTGNSTFVYRNPLRDTLMRREYTSQHNPSLGINIDYAHPLKDNWEVDAGLETSLGGGTKEQTFDTLVGGQYVSVPLRAYSGVESGIDFDLYATVQKRWGGLTVKAGLRGELGSKLSGWEYGDGSGASTVDTVFFVPVPSIHLSYQTETFTSYSLSYTRRYTTPGSSKLNPFIFYDDYSYSTGNPNLAIEYSHNLEARFNKYIMKFGNIGLNAYWRAYENEIGSMAYAGYAPAYFPGTLLVNYSRPENIGSSHTEGLEASITYRPTGFINVRLNASVWNYAYNYQGFNDHRVSWVARLNVWAKVWNKLEIFANAHYRSKSIGLYSISVPERGFDFGVSSDFFDRKMSVYLNINDIFGMAQWGSNTTAPLYQTTGSESYDSRFVSLGITFRFGKMELESKARQGASDSPMGKN